MRFTDDYLQTRYVNIKSDKVFNDFKMMVIGATKSFMGHVTIGTSVFSPLGVGMRKQALPNSCSAKPTMPTPIVVHKNQ